MKTRILKHIHYYLFPQEKNHLNLLKCWDCTFCHCAIAVSFFMSSVVLGFESSLSSPEMRQNKNISCVKNYIKKHQTGNYSMKLNKN